MAEIPNRRLRHAVAKERNTRLEAEPKGDGRWTIAACILRRHLTGFRVPRSEFTRGLLGTASSNPREDECVKRTALCFSTVVFQGRQHIWMLLDFTASPRALALRIELNTQLWRLPGPCYRWQKFQKRKTPCTLRACPKPFISTEGSECGTHEGPSQGRWRGALPPRHTTATMDKENHRSPSATSPAPRVLHLLLTEQPEVVVPPGCSSAIPTEMRQSMLQEGSSSV